MKKRIIIFGIVMSLLMLSACNKDEGDLEVIDGLANPMIEKDSLETINSEIGTNIKKPAIMGIDNDKYFVISKEIAQYSFSAVGYDWTIRGAKIIDQDISGIHNENNVYKANEDATIYLNDYYIERFFDEGYQYTITVNVKEGLDKETFSNIVLELKSMICDDEIVGEYLDSVSKRATATVEENDGIFYVYVSWASSAKETTKWTMECKKEDGKLTYNGENFATYIYGDDGKETIVGDGASNNVGWFEIIDGKLYWTGAAQDMCKDLIFEKTN